MLFFVFAVVIVAILAVAKSKNKGYEKKPGDPSGPATKTAPPTYRTSDFEEMAKRRQEIETEQERRNRVAELKAELQAKWGRTGAETLTQVIEPPAPIIREQKTEYGEETDGETEKEVAEEYDGEETEEAYDGDEAEAYDDEADEEEIEEDDYESETERFAANQESGVQQDGSQTDESAPAATAGTQSVDSQNPVNGASAPFRDSIGAVTFGSDTEGENIRILRVGAMEAGRVLAVTPKEGGYVRVRFAVQPAGGDAFTCEAMSPADARFVPGSAHYVVIDPDDKRKCAVI